jgi:ABC-type branched-subunit amino acid transport system substrate-binding protein
MPNDDIRLYRRGGAFRLVREFLTREERDGVPRSRPYPIIVFTGPRGSGRSALLRGLAARLRGNAPCALIDCQDFAGGATELLSLLAFELNRSSGRYRRLPFPRLITGLIAIRVPLRDFLLAGDREGARERMRKALEEHENTAQALRDTVGDIIEAGVTALGTIPPGPATAATEVARQVGPRLVLGWLATTRRGRKVLLGAGQDWYGHQDRELGRDPLDVLIDLNPIREEDRREVADQLWAAFAADLRHAFARRRALNWTLNCLALIDNADAPAGRQFLDDLVAARRRRASYVTADPAPLTVVATSSGVLSQRLVPRGESITAVADASYADYRKRVPGRWWYPVSLPDLAFDDVSAMVARHDLPTGTHRDAVASAVYRYTGGHPASVRLLLDGFEAGHANDDLATVLAAPQPGIDLDNPPPVAECMLDGLLAGVSAEAVENLVTCSAARDREAALRLGAESALFEGGLGTDSEVFGGSLWERSGSGLVLRPVLRRLLTRRLAARPADDKANWAAAHGRLRTLAQAAGDESAVLYHTLALGDVEQVTRRLAELLEVMDAEEWLRQLETITAAPNDLPHPAAGQIGRLVKWAQPRDLPTGPTARLVAAMWIDADPLSDRERSALRREIGASLDQIAPFSREGIGVLREYADKIRGEEQDWSATAASAGDDAEEVTFVPPQSRRGARRSRRLRTAVVALAVIVAAGGATGAYLGVDSGGGPASCAPAQGPFQVFEDSGECVGVTGGSYDFDPGPTAAERAIAATEQLIATQNEWVTRTYKSDYVSVALLTPLTEPASVTATPSDVTLARINDELSGAYLAVYDANHETGLVPKIRLLLANEGSSEQGWQADWDQLDQLRTAPGQLVAVTGMGLSVQQTIDSARTIGAAGIPMFGAVTTGDHLDGSVNPNLDQVVPSVSDEVQALARYLGKTGRAVLVYDSQTSDLYTKSLRNDFGTAFAARIRSVEIPYAPSSLDSNLFDKIAEELCYTPQQPPLVLYAGRESVFQDFITQLQEEGDCAGQKLTIVTGGDADGLPLGSTQSDTGGAQVSVVYADIEDAAAVSQAFKTDYQSWLGLDNDTGATDPWLLATYNATTAAASAIAQAAGPLSAAGSVISPGQLTTAEVRIWVNQLNGPDTVNGATGTFSIGFNGDLANPQIPIIELADGKSTTRVTETVVTAPTP